MGFVKRIGKWGLLVKPDTEQGKWHLVTSVRFIFDTEVEAYKSALEMSTSGKYLYKPVFVKVSCEYEDEEQ